MSFPVRPKPSPPELSPGAHEQIRLEVAEYAWAVERRAFDIASRQGSDVITPLFVAQAASEVRAGSLAARNTAMTTLGSFISGTAGSTFVSVLATDSGDGWIACSAIVTVIGVALAIFGIADRRTR